MKRYNTDDNSVFWTSELGEWVDAETAQLMYDMLIGLEELFHEEGKYESATAISDVIEAVDRGEVPEIEEY